MASAAAPTTLGDLTTEYTRGNPNDVDTRGPTLVERHNERMQQEKENMAIEKLSALMPALGSKLRAFALAKTDWNVDAAVELLRSFQVAELDKLNAITKKRKRIQELVEDAGEGAKAAGGGGGGGSSGSGSGDDSSGSGSGSDDSSGSDEERRRKRKKGSGDGKRRSSKDDRKRGSKDKKRKKEKRSKDKKAKKEKRDKRPRSRERDSAARAKANTTEFGKFGVIRESDADRKRSEFMAWALDVKKLDVEALAKWEEKELFKEFVEEFNTGSLPDRKYYDLAAYEMAKHKEEQEKAAKKAAARQGTRKAAELSDDKELHRRRVEERQKEQERRVKETMQALRKGGMAEEMRRQELLRAEMALAYKTGDTARAKKLFDRLAPDDPAKKR